MGFVDGAPEEYWQVLSVAVLSVSLETNAPYIIHGL